MKKNKKKYYSTGTVFFAIFAAAVIAVILIAVLIYQSGLRYIKSDAGIKYFGNVDADNNIASGRMWFESDAATAGLQKYYIIETDNPLIISSLPDKGAIFTNLTGSSNDGAFDVINIINSSLPEEIKIYFPIDNYFIFNRHYFAGGIFLRSETFDAFVKDYENADKIIQSGALYTFGGVNWILNLLPHYEAVSYMNFEIVQEGNTSKKYRGDILDFVKNEEIYYASFILSDGTHVYLYPAKDIYRIEYDKGPHSGDLYIGELNRSFERHGRGIYYFNKTGDIYYGDFTNDKITGRGDYLYALGDSYSGYLEDGKKNGEGIFKWSDGASYAGAFKDNMKNGRGKFMFADGSVYEGDYVNDIQHGRGRYTWASGEVYEGDYENGLYKGKGVYTWASGDYYEGDFDYNYPHGWGTYHWTSGRKYEGWFSVGKLVPDKPGDIDGGGESGALDESGESDEGGEGGEGDIDGGG